MQRERGRHAAADEPRAGFGEVLRLRPFAVLYTAETASIAGDQLARIALAVLVFDRTGSAAATALTYATTFLPAILGGFLLAGAGDRFSRRGVLVTCNVVRAGLFVVMSISAMPLWSLLAILVIAVFLEPAFTASQVSFLADALDAEQYRAATGLRLLTSQAAQVLGFAVGGVLVAALAPRGALLIDAASFLLSAILIGLLLPAQRRVDVGAAAADAPREPPKPRLWQVAEFRYLVILSSLAGFFVVPEGLAVPFGRSVGASTAQTGVLLASIPLGGAIGALVLIRVIPSRLRLPVALAMVIGCGLPLVVSVFSPPWPVAAALWFLSGVLSAYQVEINSLLVQQIPEQVRAHWLGIVSSLLVGAQGLGLIVFGLVAEWVSTGTSIGLSGGVGLVIAIGVCRARVRAKRTGARRSSVVDTGSAVTSVE